MKEIFLDLYDKKIDEVFLYSLGQTLDKEAAKSITEAVFTKAWDYIGDGHAIYEAESKLMDFASELTEKERQTEQHLESRHMSPTLKML